MKAQHSPGYRALPRFLRDLREDAGLTQRDLGRKMRKPQSWIFNCESGNRRVDVTEFIAWCKGCGAEPVAAFERLLEHQR